MLQEASKQEDKGTTRRRLKEYLRNAKVTIQRPPPADRFEKTQLIPDSDVEKISEWASRQGVLNTKEEEDLVEEARSALFDLELAVREL